MSSWHGREQDHGPGIGDSADLGRVWCAHRRWVAAVLLAHSSDITDLEDLLQDVAMTFVSQSREIRNPQALRPWLRTVAINTARSAGRRIHGRKRAGTHLEDGASTPALADSRFTEEVRETLRHVLTAVRKLPVKYGEPLLLKAVDGMSQIEIAGTLGLSEAAVETRLARARRMLRERLASSQTEAGAGRLERNHDRSI